MKRVNLDEAVILFKNRDRITRKLDALGICTYSTSPISCKSFNGVTDTLEVRSSTLQSFLQNEVKEINKQLKALGVTL